MEESANAASFVLVAGCGQAVLGLHLSQLGLLFFCVQFFEGLAGLVVEDHEVAVAHVEPGQVIAGIFGVEDVLVDDKRGSLVSGVFPLKNKS